MKRLILVLALIGLMAVAAGCSTKAGASLLGSISGTPKLALETTNFEFGDVVNGVVVTREVAVRNEGDAPLVVDSITTSCGCTTASLEPMTIAPGESGVLTISFDSGAHGPDLTGELMRRVFLTSNDPAQAEAAVEFTANITKPQS